MKRIVIVLVGLTLVFSIMIGFSKKGPDTLKHIPPTEIGKTINKKEFEKSKKPYDGPVIFKDAKGDVIYKVNGKEYHENKQEVLEKVKKIRKENQRNK